jgi:hypothetical protein
MDSKAEKYGARYMLLVSNPADFLFRIVLSLSIRAPCASAFLLFSVSSGDSNAVICGRDRG